jgi:hypothetical protein
MSLMQNVTQPARSHERVRKKHPNYPEVAR